MVTTMTTWIFTLLDGSAALEVDADGFEEACNLMFGDDEYNPEDWELTDTY